MTSRREAILFGVIIAGCLGMYFLYPWDTVEPGPVNSAIVVSAYTNRADQCIPAGSDLQAGTPVTVSTDNGPHWTTQLLAGFEVEDTCAMPFILPVIEQAGSYSVSIPSRGLGVRSDVELNEGSTFMLD
ncbi:hypothetical protein [Rhodococcus sp. B10]|uniref:hypothetical protein n=1 Tax=Rhodococcus sp. B10 TaxID=2695876 RepID=UPI001430DA16|nr:hypothetical protein [Rhodococcus sp. B10]